MGTERDNELKKEEAARVVKLTITRLINRYGAEQVADMAGVGVESVRKYGNINEPSRNIPSPNFLLLCRNAEKIGETEPVRILYANHRLVKEQAGEANGHVEDKAFRLNQLLTHFEHALDCGGSEEMERLYKQMEGVMSDLRAEIQRASVRFDKPEPDEMIGE